MKSFDTLQELWAYCLFCPICQKDVRTIEISVGPEPIFDIFEYKKEGNLLQLRCTYQNKRNRYSTNYDINCQDNSFQAEITEQPFDNTTVNFRGALEKVYFYFYFN